MFNTASNGYFTFWSTGALKVFSHPGHVKVDSHDGRTEEGVSPSGSWRSRYQQNHRLLDHQNLLLTNQHLTNSRYHQPHPHLLVVKYLGFSTNLGYWICLSDETLQDHKNKSSCPHLALGPSTTTPPGRRSTSSGGSTLTGSLHFCWPFVVVVSWFENQEHNGGGCLTCLWSIDHLAIWRIRRLPWWFCG